MIFKKVRKISKANFLLGGNMKLLRYVTDEELDKDEYDLDAIEVYFDCDGVILDTINAAKRVAARLGYDPNDSDSLHEYFTHDVNWKEIIDEAGTIGDIIEFINELELSGKYKPAILTKLSIEIGLLFDRPEGIDKLSEEEQKTELYKLYILKKLFPSIPIITAGYNTRKDKIVNTRFAILIEDSLKNFRYWRECVGAVAFLLSPGGVENYNYEKAEDAIKCPITEEEAPYVITDIRQFLKNSNVKCLEKRLKAS